MRFVPARDVRTSLAGTNVHPHQGQERAPVKDMGVSPAVTPTHLAGFRAALRPPALFHNFGFLWYNVPDV